jgi:membrane associated rhomboid family serine protease
VLPLYDNVPTRRFPVVTVGLIAANFLVWFWELHAGELRIDHYAYYPCSVEGPCIGTLAAHHLPAAESAFSSMFLHASWLHILGNMLFLWIFGNNVEDALGRFRFLVWYLAAGLVATATQTFVTLHYAGAAAASVPNLGASGAIAGVLGAYLLLLPTARVLTLVVFLIVPVPAYLFLGIWFLLQAWEGGFAVTHPGTGGGVAFFAHVGGFLFGAATVYLVAKRPQMRAYR